MKKRARFIVFEGLDYVGKGTQLDLAEKFLKEEGLDVVRFREPGGTKIGERIRDVLLDKTFLDMTPRTELMLFFASRTQLLEEKVEPALQAGKCVLLDRYFYSSAAYQGSFVNSPGWVLNLAEDWLRLLEPDLVVYLDGDPEVLAKRARGEKDRIEEKGVEYQKKVRRAYLEMADHRGDLFCQINAERAIEEVQKDVKAALIAHVLGGTVNG